MSVQSELQRPQLSSQYGDCIQDCQHWPHPACNHQARMLQPPACWMDFLPSERNLLPQMTSQKCMAADMYCGIFWLT